MGWSAGSEVAQTVIDALKESIPDETQRALAYRPIIKKLFDLDWDTEDEVLGEDPVFDQVLKEESNWDDEDMDQEDYSS